MNLKNILWNLFGVGVPVLIALLTIPHLIKMIGLERFGLLSVAWGVVGKVGLFDLGIGRAATQYIAKLIGKQQQGKIPGVVAIATRLTVTAGSTVALLLIISVILGLTGYFKTTSSVASELYWASIVLAVGLPIQALSATLRGVNEAFADFKGISIVRVSLGIVHFLGPFAVALFTQHLALLVATLIVSRLMAVSFYYRLASKHIKAAKSLQTDSMSSINKREVQNALLNFGGWLTVGSAAAFVLNQSERIGIGVVLAATAIATFSIPFEIVLQSTVIVTAISTIAFPQLSAMCQSSPTKAGQRFHTWMYRTVGVMAVVCVIMFGVMPTFMDWWIGKKLPALSPWIGQVLCIGVLLKTANVMTCSMLHSCGRADLTTKVRLVEAPVYLVSLYLLLANFGVLGAAYGWLLRMLLDFSALYIVLRGVALPSLIEDKLAENVQGGVA